MIIRESYIYGLSLSIELFQMLNMECILHLLALGVFKHVGV